MDSPLPAAETREIAEQLKDNVRCSLPDGLAGAVFVEPAEGQALIDTARVVVELLES